MNRGVDRRLALRTYIKRSLAGWFLATGALALLRLAWLYVSGRTWH